MKNDLGGVISLISNLSVGVPPRETDLPKLSQLCKEVLKRAENFYSATTTRQTAVFLGKPVHEEVKLRGSVALLHTYGVIEGRMLKAPEIVALDDIKPLKQFNFLLDLEQRGKVKDWLDAVIKRLACKSSRLSITGGDEDENALPIQPFSSASSSRASVSMTTAIPPKAPKKKEVAAAEKVQDKRAMMLKFFPKRKA